MVVRHSFACVGCGGTFVRSRARPQRYCSRSCARKAGPIGRGGMTGRGIARWHCPMDGLAYAEHPKCGGLRAPCAYSHADAASERSVDAGRPRTPRRCGILVGPGHAYGMQDVFPDGRCRSCHAEDTRNAAPMIVSRYETDWDAEVPSAWVRPGPPAITGITDPAHLTRRRTYKDRAKERSA